MAEQPVEIIWQPSDARIQASRLYDYMQWLARERGLQFHDYESLWQWSVDHLEDFWASIWSYFDVRHHAPYTQVLDRPVMPGARWFDGAQLNFAEQAFRFHRDAEAVQRPAIMSRSELRGLETMSWAELERQVASFAHALRCMGVVSGDRVVSYLPNVPEAIVAFLACASLGAIWSSCSPDMGSNSVLDRFRQIEPKVLIAVDGYRYGGRDHDRRAVVTELRAALPTLEQLIVLPYLDPEARFENAHDWHALVADDVALSFMPVAFDHPLWVVYSSGTTGMPKPIVHGHGGALLETLKGHALQLDLGENDRFMWFSTTGWIMWNSQVGGLLVGATVCIYDGNPGYPELATLWRFAEETQMTFFGAGAAYFTGCRKAGLVPREQADLHHLRSVGSTGSPLPADAYRWIMDAVGDVMIAAISGGTDIAAAFVGSCPIKPVVVGEMQARGLGIAAYAFDDDGRALDDAVGELVVTKPMPSMPLYFWNDTDGSRLHGSYFDTYPGIWRHGDWIRITPRGGAVIYGRSDTTINRHGVRMGSGEIYAVVEGQFDAIRDSLVVDLEYLGRASWLALFVVMADGVSLDDTLRAEIRDAIRRQLSPRHTPDDIVAIDAVPRTLTGKKMELPIKKLLLGMDEENAVSRDAMANPDSLAFFRDYRPAIA